MQMILGGACLPLISPDADISEMTSILVTPSLRVREKYSQLRPGALCYRLFIHFQYLILKLTNSAAWTISLLEWVSAFSFRCQS